MLCRGVAIVISSILCVGAASAEVSTLAPTPPVPLPKPRPMKDRIRKLPAPSAKQLFKAVRVGADLKPASLGFYTRGCLAGAKQLETDGPSWQAMRLSRNRHWGHPQTVATIKRLATEAKMHDGWPGLLVGDISMPRGGPMWPSHASHQIGLDADIWLTPMPNTRMTRRKRERLSATFMLTSNHLSVNRKVWTDAHGRLIKRAASYRAVQRVLVHPSIKRELCRTAGLDRAWLAKVRPVGGHNYHFHIRLRCPTGSTGCRPQTKPRRGDGCGAELDRWHKRLVARLKPSPKPRKKPIRRKPHRYLMMNDLPRACRKVLVARDRIVPPPPRQATRVSAPKIRAPAN